MKLFCNSKSENFPNDNNVINNNFINNDIINNVAINNHSPQNHIININVILSIILSIIFIFGIAGCSLPSLDSHDINNNSYNLQTSSDNSSADDYTYSDTDNEAFTQFTHELFCESVASDTLTMHSLLEHPSDFGIDDYDVTLGRFNTDSLDDTNELTETLNKLLSFDTSTLSKSQRLTYDELKKNLETGLEYSDLYMFNTQLSTTVGIQIELPLIFAEYSFEEEKDVTEYLTLLEDTDEFFQSIADYEKLRSDNGYFMEDTLASEIIDQCREFASSASDGFLTTTFIEKIGHLSDIPNDKKNEYIKHNQTAIDEHLIKGYNLLADSLSSLVGTNRYKGGLCNYPNGDKYFEYLLQSNLGWSKSVGELNGLTDHYLKKNLITMQRLLANDTTLSAKADAFSFNITKPDLILTDLKSKIKNDFPDAPDVNYSIEYISDSLKDYASPAMYFTPQLDNLSVNSIYINPTESDSNTLYATLAHEGYPGHMYQMTYFTSSNPDPIRFVIQPSGFLEGWATYCEVHSYQYADTGNYALNQIAQANYAAVLCLYAKMDIGINYYGWDEENTANFLNDYGFDKNAASDIYKSMISEPGNYCKYVLGYIGFSELKETAKQQLKDSFNLKEFHRFIMDTGPVSFDTLNTQLKLWMEQS